MRKVILLCAVLLPFASLSLGQAPLPPEGPKTVMIDGRRAIADELLIRWKDGTSTTRKEKVLRRLGAALIYRFRLIDADWVRIPSAKGVQPARREAASCSEVEKTYPNYLLTLSGAESTKKAPPSLLPNDPGLYRQWWWFAIGTHVAQEYVSKPKEVLIGVVDTGVVLNHEDLKKNLWQNQSEFYGIKGYDDDNNGYVDDVMGINVFYYAGIRDEYPRDIAQHGTNISGILGSSVNNYIGTSGIVDKLKIVHGKFLDDWIGNVGSASYCVEYCSIIGCNIINASWGGDEYDPLFEIIKNGKFTLFSAAGNKNNNIDIIKEFPASYNINNNIAIMSTSMYLSKSSFSSYGLDTVDLAAPGEFIYTTSNEHSDALFNPSTTPYDFVSGTSFATPVALGCAALTMSAHPRLSNLDAVELLYDTVDQLRDLVGKVKNAGQVNAARAVLGRSAGGALTLGGWQTLSRGGPSPRSNHSMVYDSRRDRLVLFGGEKFGSPTEYYGDTWEFDGHAWQRVAVDGPEARSWHVLVYDERRGVTVLYGGEGQIGNRRRTWEWDGASWKAVETDKRPEDDRGAAAVYDAARGAVLLVTGGGESWNYDGAGWTKLAVGSPGQHRGGFAVAYDAQRKRTVLAGITGVDGHGISTVDRWELSGKRWKRVGSLPLDIDGAQDLVYDPLNKRLLAFTKESAVMQLANLWVLEPKGLSLASVPPQIPRQYGAAAFDGRRNRLVMHGGVTAIGTSGETTSFSGAIADTWVDNLPLGASDYDGDGRADTALWRPRDGSWIVPGKATITLGQRCDVPVPGDYDGDGIAEPGVWRRTEGMWITLAQKVKFGAFNDIPVPADYDGDGRTDIALWRPDDGSWLIKGKKTVRFGQPCELPVPADYDGDGRAERALYNPTTAEWRIEGEEPVFWGNPGDSPVPADYDGDGAADIATFNPRTRVWLVRNADTGKVLMKKRFGSAWDIPVPGDFNGDGVAELATFNPDSGAWNIRGMASVTNGRIGDVPLVRGR